MASIREWNWWVMARSKSGLYCWASRSGTTPLSSSSLGGASDADKIGDYADKLCRDYAAKSVRNNAKLCRMDEIMLSWNSLYFLYLWMSPAEFHIWNTDLFPSVKPEPRPYQCMCIEIHCVCECHRPNSTTGSPIYFPVENLDTSLCV